jgi:hypothetical protein
MNKQLENGMPRKTLGKSGTAIKPALVNISFGNVQISITPPTPSELKKRIAESNVLVRKIRLAISRPGIKLNIKASTPLYSADVRDPSLIIRKVGTTRTRGRFNSNGKFIRVK